MGFAETDITPGKPAVMVGFNRADNMSRGILDCLTAQVSVWEGNGICCLVTIDNIGFTKEEADLLRGRIAEITGTSREKVMLAFSHTHAAVDTGAEKEYYAMLCRKIYRAAEEAKARMCEVSVGWDNAEADIGSNRRASSDRIDRRVGILKICSAGGDDVLLIILRLTAHPNVLKRDNYLISADYFGTVRRVFGEKYHCPVMIVQGSAGNIAPKYYKASFTPIDARGEAYINFDTALESMAQEVLKKAGPVLDAITTDSDADVCAYSKFMSLQSKVPDMAEAHRIAEEALKHSGMDGQKWLAEIERLHGRGICVQEERLEIQYFRIGDWCLCGIPNETMTEFALETQRLLDSPFFYFNGYTNGCTSYFPTKEEYDLGGYEVYWAMLLYFADYGRVYPYRCEAIDSVISCAVENYIRGRCTNDEKY